MLIKSLKASCLTLGVLSKSKTMWLTPTHTHNTTMHYNACTYINMIAFVTCLAYDGCHKDCMKIGDLFGVRWML